MAGYTQKKASKEAGAETTKTLPEGAATQPKQNSEQKSNKPKNSSETKLAPDTTKNMEPTSESNGKLSSRPVTPVKADNAVLEPMNKEADIPSLEEQPAAKPQTATAEEIGWTFVQQYYTFMNKSPKRLHCFYKTKSSMIRGKENEELITYFGQKGVHERIMELNYSNCKVLVSNVDCQASLFGSIIVMVLGELSNNDGPAQRFAQTFVLCEQERGFFVLNDIFRFLKEDYNENYKGEVGFVGVEIENGEFKVVKLDQPENATSLEVNGTKPIAEPSVPTLNSEEKDHNSAVSTPEDLHSSAPETKAEDVEKVEKKPTEKEEIKSLPAEISREEAPKPTEAPANKTAGDSKSAPAEVEASVDSAPTEKKKSNNAKEAEKKSASSPASKASSNANSQSKKPVANTPPPKTWANLAASKNTKQEGTVPGGPNASAPKNPKQDNSGPGSSNVATPKNQKQDNVGSGGPNASAPKNQKQDTVGLGNLNTKNQKHENGVPVSSNTAPSKNQKRESTDSGDPAATSTSNAQLSKESSNTSKAGFESQHRRNSNSRESSGDAHKSSLCIRNIKDNTSDDVIRSAFGVFGEIRSVYHSGHIVFLEFSKAESCAQALAQDSILVDGHPVHVELRRPRSNYHRGGFYNRRGNNGSRRGSSGPRTQNNPASGEGRSNDGWSGPSRQHNRGQSNRPPINTAS